jgi:alpha-L-rhamnosidase
MLRDDPDFVRQRLPGVRAVIDWYEAHMDQTELLGPTPWWNFLDWAPAFNRGVPPHAEDGHSTAISLQLAYALEQAGEMEASIGRADSAAHDRQLAQRIIAAAQAQSWDAQRGLFKDSPEAPATFSQQTNALAVLAGAAPDARATMQHVLSDSDLVQATYYFRFYVDEAMRQAGMADGYLDRLGPWREMIRNGLTTTPETPEPSRSDSHAWSAHPNYQLLATVLGVRPASPGFRTVSIAPALGPLQHAEGEMPHPDGQISVRLRRVGTHGVNGQIMLPGQLSGSFQWAGHTVALHSGRNVVSVR